MDGSKRSGPTELSFPECRHASVPASLRPVGVVKYLILGEEDLS